MGFKFYNEKILYSLKLKKHSINSYIRPISQPSQIPGPLYEIMRHPKTIIALLVSAILLYFIFRPSNAKLRDDLNSKNRGIIIMKAAYKLGERKDKLAIRPLLTNILDPRMSTNMNFKGMTVCYCKLCALKKISGLSPPIEMDQFWVDTAIAKFYLEWAIKEKIIESEREIDLAYYP